MTHTEWIVSIDDDLKDHDEMFVGNVRDGEMITRCKDCRNYVSKYRFCLFHEDDRKWDVDDYCSVAERKDSSVYE